MHKVDYLANNWLAIKTNNETVEKNFKNFKGTVYDLGCGERPYEKDILKVADKYIGVDWGDTLHNLKADIVSDLNKPLPIDSEVAETVTSFQVIEHLCEPQIMLNEAYRILKRSGNIILTVPFQWWIHEAPYDYFRYTIYGLRYMFEKSGFISFQKKCNEYMYAKDKNVILKSSNEEVPGRLLGINNIGELQIETDEKIVNISDINYSMRVSG